MELTKLQRQTLAIQKAFTTDDGKEALKWLVSITKPDVVQVPEDSNGRVDTYIVGMNEGKRSVMAQLRAKLNKSLNESKQKEAINE